MFPGSNWSWKIKILLHFGRLGSGAGQTSMVNNVCQNQIFSPFLRELCRKSRIPSSNAKMWVLTWFGKPFYAIFKSAVFQDKNLNPSLVKFHQLDFTACGKTRLQKSLYTLSQKKISMSSKSWLFLYISCVAFLFFLVHFFVFCCFCFFFFSFCCLFFSFQFSTFPSLFTWDLLLLSERSTCS